MRQAAEGALTVSEERYRRLVEMSPETIAVYCDGSFVYVNATGARVFDAGSPEDVITSGILDTINPAYFKTVLAQNGHRLQGILIEQRIARPTGQIMDAEIVGIATTYHNKPAVQIIIRDITERKQAEDIRARRGRQATLRSDLGIVLSEQTISLTTTLQNCADALVDNMDAGLVRIWLTNDKDETLDLQATSGPCTVLSTDQTHLPSGESMAGLIAGRREPYVSNDISNDNLVDSQEWTAREKLISFAGYPLMIDDKLIGVMTVFFRQVLAEDTLDALATVANIISQGIERKHGEEALRHSEEQLHQSQRLEAVGKLAAGVAHDFNNLLTAIIGYSDIGMRGLRPDDPLLKNFGEIRKAGERAANLTRQLLAFSRKQMLQPKILDLNHIVTDMSNMLGRLIGENISLSMVYHPKLGSVKADPAKWSRLF